MSYGTLCDINGKPRFTQVSLPGSDSLGFNRLQALVLSLEVSFISFVFCRFTTSVMSSVITTYTRSKKPRLACTKLLYVPLSSASIQCTGWFPRRVLAQLRSSTESSTQLIARVGAAPENEISCHRAENESGPEAKGSPDAVESPLEGEDSEADENQPRRLQAVERENRDFRRGSSLESDGGHYDSDFKVGWTSAQLDSLASVRGWV